MVEWKRIEEIGHFFGGLTGKTKEDFVAGNAKFITYVNVFANPSLDISSTGVVRIKEGEKQNKIQKGDILFTASSETPEETGMSCVVADELHEDYYMNSFCFGVRLNQPEQYNLGYLKHLFRSFNIRKDIAKSASGVTRFNISKARFGKILIPFPSLSEQQRIVGILDTFASCIDNLKEQIAQRRKQYEYYRDQLLDLEGKEGVEIRKLGDLSLIKTGTKPDEIKTSGLYKYINAGTSESGYVDKTNCAGNVTTTPSRGQGGIGYVGYQDSSFWLGPLCYQIRSIDNKAIVDKFMFYYLSAHNEQILKYKSEGGTPALNAVDLKKIECYLPSLSEQQRIVSILDTFEASIRNLEAQLAERQKQYEYYRNKLLTFE